MEMIAAYLAGIVVFIGMFAVRVPHEDLRVVFILGMIWPVSVVAIAGMMLLGAINWDMDMAKGNTLFGFRKPGNPEIKGFAFTVLFQEFQFYSKRKNS